MNTRTPTGSVKDYYERLGGLETRMDTVERTLEGHGAKLDQVLSAVSSHQPFEPLRIMQFIAFSVAILASVGTVITYVASSTNASRIAIIEFQTQEIWRAGHWTVDSRNVTTRVKNAAAQ